MHDEQQLSGLIGDIYDATLDPLRWEGVLRKAAHFVGGSTSALVAKSAASKTGTVVYTYGADPHYRDLYFDRYIKLDPAKTGRFFVDFDQPYAAADVIHYEEFLTTRFYKEWMQPQGLVDFVVSRLAKSTMGSATFVVFRHERDGLVDEETRQRMRLVAPHFRRAVLIDRLTDSKLARTAMFAVALDGINAGMFLIDATARIVHANVAGHDMLNAGNVLNSVGGRLVPVDGQADQALREVFAVAGSGDDAVGIKGIAVPLTGLAGERYVAHVLPLTSGERRRAGVAYTAVAAMFVRKAEMEAAAAPEVIASTYRLTPTELRVLLAIVEVGGVPEVAAALGVAETTVKTHLGRLFEKTDTARQADLVKLVAGFGSPLRDC